MMVPLRFCGKWNEIQSDEFRDSFVEACETVTAHSKRYFNFQGQKKASEERRTQCHRGSESRDRDGVCRPKQACGTCQLKLLGGLVALCLGFLVALDLTPQQDEHDRDGGNLGHGNSEQKALDFVRTRVDRIQSTNSNLE